ncbi:MAG TPA: hypothetical protein V6D04_10720 [Candidatus Obscuribacterales bacterium]
MYALQPPLHKSLQEGRKIPTKTFDFLHECLTTEVAATSTKAAFGVSLWQEAVFR